MYPQFTDFNEALQNPRTAFTDAELQNAQADTNPLGLPVALGGGFTYTYPMTTTRGKVAVRCFHRQVPSAEQRYDAIVMANVPLGYGGLTREQDAMIAHYVHDIGGGLVMIAVLALGRLLSEPFTTVRVIGVPPPPGPVLGLPSDWKTAAVVVADPS